MNNIMFASTMLRQAEALLNEEDAATVQSCANALQQSVDEMAHAEEAAKLAQLANDFRQRTATARRLRNAVSDQMENTVDSHAIARYRQEYQELSQRIAGGSALTRLFGALARLIDSTWQYINIDLMMSAATAYNEAVAPQDC
jgi:DNA repair exonuclease SbcCD ATPase subunit